MLLTDKIAEDIIAAAVARGEFDNLPGHGLKNCCVTSKPMMKKPIWWSG